MSGSFLIKGGSIVTMDENNSIVHGDLLIRNGRIESIGTVKDIDATIIEASGCVVLPGLVQTHLHLCQTLFRGAADDLSLIDWLKKRVWPLEAAHTAASITASAKLGIAELIKGGTTCALTMETVSHTDEVFKVVDETGFRATVGKCMMDKGEEVPPELQEDTEASIAASLALLNKWHGRADGRIRYCFAPRFAISCTAELLSTVAQLARQRDVMIHTHASENRTECAMVEQETGMRNIAYLESVGISGKHVALAHCVHVDSVELNMLSSSGTNVVHCPSSNLKLGSGIAPVKEMLQAGVSVSLGADGAACNNRLDMFTEMRTAALLQKAQHGPEVLPAQQALRLATIEGAKAMGLDQEIGSIELGKRADIVVLNISALHLTPAPTDLASAIVYSAQPDDVQTVIVAGRLVLRERQLLTLDEARVRSDANEQAVELFKRAGIV